MFVGFAGSVMEKLRKFCEFKRVYCEEQEREIDKEFKRLEGHHYLEHAGATLYSEKQIQDVFSDLSKTVHGNPHAEHNIAKVTEDTIDQVRYQVLKQFRTDSSEYTVIFTSGTTASLKLIAESFVYTDNETQQNGSFVHLLDNHTSVLGMRQYAPKTEYFTQNDLIETLNSSDKVLQQNPNTNSLFVYPAPSNFSGTKYPLWWIEKIQNGALNGVKNLNSKNWFVLLDAPCLYDVLDLSQYKPDFVTVSFYKIFGYPTGVGALLVRNSSGWVLQRKYLGGGTVLMALSTENVMIPRRVLHERFEDGTLPFLSITAVRHGFLTLKRLNLHREIIAEHTFELARYVYRNLITLHHFNGKPVAVVYNDTQFSDVKYQGGIVNFNLLRSDGEYVGYSEVLHVSNLYNIHLRTGCFCNPGACQTHLKLTAEDVRHQFSRGHVCGDQNDLIDGYPTGSVRISFGYMSKKDDADAFLRMIEDYFVAKPAVRKIPQIEHTQLLFFNTKENCSDVYIESLVSKEIETKGILEKVFLYPIKSCGAFEVQSNWELVSTGLKYDRQWMIINSSGVCVTQKHNRRLCLIKPFVNLSEDVLTLTYEGAPNIHIQLHEDNNQNLKESSLCHSKVCGDRIIGWDCGDEAAKWLCDVLEMEGLRLLKQCSDDVARMSKTGDSLPLSLTNKAQYLLINKASVQWLLDSIPGDEFQGNIYNLVDRFRPNMLVDLHEPLIENDLTEIIVSGNVFKFDGNCTRCQMICIDQVTAEKTAEPLKTLSRKLNGKIAFGVYLKQKYNAHGFYYINKGSSVFAK